MSANAHTLSVGAAGHSYGMPLTGTFETFHVSREYLDENSNSVSVLEVGFEYIDLSWFALGDAFCHVYCFYENDWHYYESTDQYACQVSNLEPGTEYIFRVSFNNGDYIETEKVSTYARQPISTDEQPPAPTNGDLQRLNEVAV